MDAVVKDQVESRLKQHFRPEFINRIDDIVIFSPLTEEQIEHIIDLSLEDIQKRLEERQISLQLTEAAKRKVFADAYTPQYGARPVKRYLQKYVETGLARKMIQGDIDDQCRVVIDVDQDQLVFQTKSLV